MNDNKNKKKIVWSFIIVILVLNLVFFGLLIWGIVVLCLPSTRFIDKYHQDVLGGLLVGLDAFFIIFFGINLSSYIINNPHIKKEFLDYFKDKFSKKDKKLIDKEDIQC